MNDDRFEPYSSLLDGESEISEHKALLDALSEDDSARERVGRYSLIGEALRGEAPKVDAQGVADAVRERLQREPAILAPSAARLPQRPGWRQAAAGLAIAASVALVAVGVVPGMLSEGVDQASAPVQVVGVPPVTPTLVSYNGTRWTEGRPQQDSRLNGYLADHQEFATQNSVSGIVPYATFVSYDGQ